jgi:hypothetical protein
VGVRLKVRAIVPHGDVREDGQLESREQVECGCIQTVVFLEHDIGALPSAAQFQDSMTMMMVWCYL